jgi:hypothetical protein
MEYDIEQLVLGRMSRSRFWMSMSVLGGSWVTLDMVLACGDSDTKAIQAAIPAYAPRVLCDHGRGQLSQDSDYRFLPFEVTFAVGYDRRSCHKQTLRVVEA